MGHVIAITKGSGGDLIPFIHIGKRLQARDHQVTILTHCHYEASIKDSGLAFVALDKEDEFRQMVVDQDVLRSEYLQGLKHFYQRHIFPNLIREYEQIRELGLSQECVLVCNSNSILTANIVAEKLGLPLICTFISPAFLNGIAVLSGLFETLTTEINEIRKRINLPLVSDWYGWLTSSQKNICLWPEWFAPPEANWPARTKVTGFAKAEKGNGRSIPKEVQDFLRVEETILITHGTTKATSPKFFEALVEGCYLSGYRGLLVTPYISSIPNPLPDNVMWQEFLPFTEIMSQITAVAHHGGIGMTSDGLVFGRPQLILPDGLDCYDNATRLEQLGVGKHLPATQWQSGKVAELLPQLLLPSVVSRCQELANRLRGEDALTTICTAIEESISTQNKPSLSAISEERKTNKSINELSVPAMRILLVQRSTYFPTRGGADKANRCLMEALAEKGHVCQAVMSAIGTQGFISQAQLQEELKKRAVHFVSLPGADLFNLGGVEIHAITDGSQQRAYLEKLIHEFKPTRILVSSEDTGQVWLEVALKAAPNCVVYLAHTPLMLPFGPKAFLPSEVKTKLLSQVTGVLAASHYLSEYIERWSGTKSAVIPYPVYGSGPFRSYGCFSKGYVTIINPCAYKGISIFMALAQALPHIQFAAVPTWGTTVEERLILEQLPNVQILEAVDDIDEIYAQTRILLIPSLWAEAFGLVAVEAMLRGIPVLASNVGGLPEAKLGVEYVLPVRQIENYSDGFDEQMKPKAIVLEQDIDVWLKPLQALLTDESHYEKIATASRKEAHKFVSSISVEQFESYLEKLSSAVGANLKNDKSIEENNPNALQKAVRELADGLSPEKRMLLLQKLREKKATQSAKLNTISKLPRQEGQMNVFPASFAQQRLWLSTQLGSDSAVYSTASAFRLCGILNHHALKRSIDEIIRRHEVLRTTFTVKEGKLAQVIRPFLDMEVAIVDLTTLSPDKQEEVVNSLTAEEDQRPFDLANGPLLHVTLLQLKEAEHILLLTMHHIVCDGWSVPIFLQEMAALYAAFTEEKLLPLPHLNLQYADYAVWQKEWLQGEVLDRQVAYWKRQLSGHLTTQMLKGDRPQQEKRSFRGTIDPLKFSPSLTTELKLFSKQEGATLFMTLLTVFKILLHYYGGHNDVFVGTDIANRNRVEIEGLIGFFTNQLVLRTDLSGNPTFRELLHRVRQVALAAYEHQDLPFEKLVEVLNPERSSGPNPLFQVKFVLQTDMLPAVDLPGIELDTVKVENKTAKFDLLLNLWDSKAGLFGFWEYNVDLFKRTTILQLSKHLSKCASIAMAQPDINLETLCKELARVNEAGQAEKSQRYKEALQQQLKRVKRKRSLRSGGEALD